MDKSRAKDYMEKAVELLAAATLAADNSMNNAAVIDSIHCAINALDAVAVFYFGKRQI